MDNDLLYLLTILAVLRNLKRHIYRSFHCFIPDRYTTEMPLDLPFAYRQSESRTPIVLLYTQEANMVEKLVIEGAQRKQVCKSFVCKNSWCQKCNDFFVCLCFKFSLLILDFMDFSLPICFSQVELHVLALANVGIGEERAARKTIHKAMVQVCKLQQ